MRCANYQLSSNYKQLQPVDPVIIIAVFLGLVATIASDELIRIFGQHQLLRKGQKLSWSEVNQVRGKLRFLARLLHTVRELSATELSFDEYLRPEYYDTFVAAVLQIRDANKQLALTLGHYIKQLCLLNIAESIKSRNKQMKADSEDFLQLFNSSWTSTVSSATVRMQQIVKLNKAQDLPLTKDLMKITTFIKKDIDKQMTAVRERNYTRLQKLVVTALLLFNKRRPAEVTDIKIGDYQLSLANHDDRPEIIGSLSPEERAVLGR